MSATAARLHIRFVVEFNCWRQQVAYISFTVEFNSWRQQVAFTSIFQLTLIDGNSRSPVSPLSSGIQWTVQWTGRLRLHFSVEFNGWRQQVAYTSTLQWNSMICDTRSPSPPLFSGIQLLVTADRHHIHFSEGFSRWRQQVAFISTFV